MITRVVDGGLIKEVPIVETEELYTHGQFFDDTNVIVEANKEYVEETFEIFQCMGKALEIFVKEIGVKAVFISNLPMIDEIRELNFCWEDEAGTTKLLGFFVGVDLSPTYMVKYLTKALENRLKIAWRNPQSLMVRVKMANQLITCIL